MCQCQTCALIVGLIAFVTWPLPSTSNNKINWYKKKGAKDQSATGNCIKKRFFIFHIFCCDINEGLELGPLLMRKELGKQVKLTKIFILDQFSKKLLLKTIKMINTHTSVLISFANNATMFCPKHCDSQVSCNKTFPFCLLQPLAYRAAMLPQSLHNT